MRVGILQPLVSRASNQCFNRPVCARGLRTAQPLVLHHKVDDSLDLFVAMDGDATVARPANGGLRLWNYETEGDAIEEVSRLATGMGFKHGMYNTGFSGGKLVCRARTPDALNTATSTKKKEILATAGIMLNKLNGAVFTGCDMNMGIKDMVTLREATPYVLASLGGHVELDANKATAWGVIGATQGVMASVLGGVRGKTVLIHGIGGVGSTTARVLSEAGAIVKTFDLFSDRADIPGCENMSHLSTEQFITQECDVLVPCSVANLISEELVSKLQCKVIASAANLPFSTPAARKATEARGVVFVPESICSAGAIILDSIEAYAPEDYPTASPDDVYRFVSELTMSKAVEFYSHYLHAGGLNAETLARENRESSYVGTRFSSWKAARERMSRREREEPLRKAARALVADANLKSPKTAAAMRLYSTKCVASDSTPRRSFSTAPDTYDTIITGGGIMGLNIAYQIKRRDPNQRVLVLESQPAVGYGSSGYSTGFLRAYYSFDETMQFALDGINAYKNWEDYCKFSSKEESDVKFTETGALWMLGYSPEKNVEMQRRLASFGVESDVLDKDSFERRFPLMSSDPCPEYNRETGELVERDWGELSAVHEHGAGHIDSISALLDMVKVCEREGVEVRFKSKVAKFEEKSGVVQGVEMVDGTKIQGGNVVNCAGPWFGALNESVGVETSTTCLPTRIQVAHKQLPDEYLDLPFTADCWGDSGVYFMPRRQNNQMVFGSIAHRFESEVVDPDKCNPALDPDVKEDYLSCLFHRLPGLETGGEIIGFSSMYTVNQDDVHPVMGETKEVKGLWVCNGFSGHGFKLAPAVGSLLAQGITGVKLQGGEFETNTPLDFMGPNRKPLNMAVKTHFA